ncbi:MAG: HNH endonuclease domain-containing protein, partial [Pseudomonadota bacterium]
HQAALEDSPGMTRLLDHIEWTLILMPLPRVQVVGAQQRQVLYRIGWGLEIERSKRLVSDYQRGRPSSFDNRILLLEGVGRSLVQLGGLLRPLIHREWIHMVAQINKLEESRLESFLFGADRVSTARLRAGLIDLQGGRCFYCADALKSSVEVDHFIPWARYPDNSVQNLVAAHTRCNGSKSDHLAASGHVAAWGARLVQGSALASDLHQLAHDVSWESHRERSLGVARGIYLRLPDGTLLWQGVDAFVPLQADAIRRALAA